MEEKENPMTDKIMPKHVAYHRDLFMGSARVNRRLDWLQRHIYLRLCLEACFCETRPYLPTNDEELALLADVPESVWEENKAPVLAMFTKSNDGYTHPRIVSEWERVSNAFEQRRDAAKRGGAANAKRVEESRSAPAQKPNASHTDLDSNRDHEHETPTTSGNGVIDANVGVSSLRSSSNPNENPKQTQSPTDSLVHILSLILSQRQARGDVIEGRPLTIRDDADTYAFADFEDALSRYSFDEVRHAVLVSQTPRNQKYFIRSAGILKSLDSLVEQSSSPAQMKANEILWKQALSGKLPKMHMEKPKTLTEAVNGGSKKEFEIEEDLDSL